MITVNDTYAFQEGHEVAVEPFLDIIGKYFKDPEEGLGNDDSAFHHRGLTMANPNRPL